MLDKTDDADRVLLWENDLQFKKVKKLQYVISQYSTYRSIVIIFYHDLGIVIIFYHGASDYSHPYNQH